MTGLPFFQIDAFASRPFEGNQACVMPMDAFLPDATLQAIAAENNVAETAFIVPRMKIARIGRFFALVPARPSLEIDALACKTVMAFERFRAPLSEADIARRQPGSLTIAQLRNLHRWGYPHVLDTFRFHMTLTGPVPESDRATVEHALQEWFAPVIDLPMNLGSLSLMREAEPGAPFRVHEHAPLHLLNERMTA